MNLSISIYRFINLSKYMNLSIYRSMTPPPLPSSLHVLRTDINWFLDNLNTIFTSSRPLYLVVVPYSREQKQGQFYNIWRIACTVLGFDVNSTQGIIAYTQLSLPLPHGVFFVYSIPQLNRFMEMYAFEVTIL